MRTELRGSYMYLLLGPRVESVGGGEGGGGGIPQKYQNGYVPPDMVVILELLIYNRVSIDINVMVNFFIFKNFPRRGYNIIECTKSFK